MSVASTVDRSVIVARLREISSLLELRGGNKLEARAFARGARALEATHAPLSALIEEGRLVELPGIGTGVARHIEELSRTGESELLESLRRGLGSAGVDQETRAPSLLLADGLRLATELGGEMEAMPETTSVHLAGSLRRSAELSSDLDFVVEAKDPAGAVARIATMPRIGSVETRGDTDCRLRLADGTRVDVVACTTNDLPTALAHEIASPSHLARLRQHAAERGLRLERGGLFEAVDGKRVPLRDEAQLYAKLGLSWVPPEMREDIGEIELAERGDAFDLVEENDIRGFVHCHSTWSDGKNTIEEMARAAEAHGASFITITDHSGAAHYANGLDVERLERQWDEIADVQERVSIKLLRGAEADILADGSLDCPDHILERLDVVIASIHNRFHQDEATMTERVLRAMRHPFFKIWGHPLGRLLTSRPPIALRVEEVLDALAASRGAIEINGNSQRLDLEPRWARAARERGIPAVLSVDAHSIRDFDNLRYAVGLARRAGLRRTDVLNTRSAAAFMSAVRPALPERAGAAGLRSSSAR